jgi:CBS domain-containing protein
LLLGESARGELLAPGLAAMALVCALVYDDAHASFQSTDRAYFSALADETLDCFRAFGFTQPDLFWTGGSHPGMALSDWRQWYCETVRNPLDNGIYIRREFFDVMPLSGAVAMLDELHREISRELQGNEMLVPLLANDTLAHLPPLTFFRGLVLELDGVERDSFDIVSTAITPIVDAARVFAIAQRRLTAANTLQRLRDGECDYPQEAALFREAADAFRIGLYYQALAGGARIHPDKLGRFDQLLLKNAFSSIHRLLEFTLATFIPAA